MQHFNRDFYRDISQTEPSAHRVPSCSQTISVSCYLPRPLSRLDTVFPRHSVEFNSSIEHEIYLQIPVHATSPTHELHLLRVRPGNFFRAAYGFAVNFAAAVA